MTKKEIAIAFIELAGNGHAGEAFSKYTSLDFIHHNQYFEGSRVALETAINEDHKTNPNKSFEIKNVFEDGETVITHSLVSKQEMGIAVVHIFRFMNNEIVELWDLGQVIEKDSPNKHGLF